MTSGGLVPTAHLCHRLSFETRDSTVHVHVIVLRRGRVTLLVHGQEAELVIPSRHFLGPKEIALSLVLDELWHGVPVKPQRVDFSFKTLGGTPSRH